MSFTRRRITLLRRLVVAVTALAVSAISVVGVGPQPLELTAPAAAANSYDTDGPEGTIYRLYRAYFLREPEAEGFNYWLGVYQQGYPLDAISNDFARSAEFQQQYGDLDNQQFLDRVYANVLGRQPDSDGFTYWFDQMSRGMLRGYVMIYFSDSNEFTNRTSGGTPPGYETDGTTWITGYGTTGPDQFTPCGVLDQQSGLVEFNWRVGYVAGDVHHVNLLRQVRRTGEGTWWVTHDQDHGAMPPWTHLRQTITSTTNPDGSKSYSCNHELGHSPEAAPGVMTITSTFECNNDDGTFTVEYGIIPTKAGAGNADIRDAVYRTRTFPADGTWHYVRDDPDYGAFQQAWVLANRSEADCSEGTSGYAHHAYPQLNHF